MTRIYERQASSARDAAIAEGKNIAKLAQKRADLSKDEARYQGELTDALKREATSEKRDAGKARRAREHEDRRRENERKTAERLRQHEQLCTEQQRRVDREDTHTRIAQTEEPLLAQITALKEPKPERLRILCATATPQGRTARLAGDPSCEERGRFRVAPRSY